MRGISKFEKIPAEYMVICDSDIMFCGDKKECLAYYDSLENPIPMSLIKIQSKKELIHRAAWRQKKWQR